MPSDAEAGRWNYRPEIPVPLNPLFSWPPRPIAVFNWYRGAWLQFASLSVCFSLALLALVVFLPPLADMAEFRPSWMIRIWFLNIIPQTMIAGGLHWWFWVRKGQGDRRKFDHRDLARCRLDNHTDDLAMFLVGKRRRFTGGADRDDAAGAFGDMPFNQLLQSRFIHLAITEGGDKRRDRP